MMFDDERDDLDEATAAYCHTWACSPEVAERHRLLRPIIGFTFGGYVPSTAELVAALAERGIQTNAEQVAKDIDMLRAQREWERG